MIEEKISKESAEVEFQNILDRYDLLIDVKEMEEEDKTDFLKLRNRLVRAIMRGNLYLDDLAVYKTKDGLELKFDEIGTSAMAEIDKAKGTFSGMTKIIGRMTKQPPEMLSKLKGEDYKCVFGLGNLFLD